MKKTILTAALAFLLPCTVLADGFENVSVRSDATIGKVLIQGEYQSDISERWITAVITDRLVLTEGNLAASAYGAIQAKIGEDGSFSGELVMPESAGTGEYMMLLVPEFGEQYSVSFSHQSRGEINDALRRINAMTDGAGILSEITAAKDVLKLDAELLTGEGIEQEKLAPILLGCRPEGGWNSIQELDAAMKNTRALYDVNAARDEKALDQALKALGETSDFPANEYLLLQESIKKAVAEDLIKEQDFTSLFALKERYRELRVIRSITAAPNWSYTKTVLTETEIQNKLSQSAKTRLAAIRYPEEVYKKIYQSRSGISTLGDVIRLYEESIDTVYTSENQSQNQGSGGGNGSGGGSSRSDGKLIAPSVTPEQIVKAQSFSDLSEAEWAREAIEYLAEQGFVSGMDDQHFCPNEPITREQFAKMLVDALGYEEQGNLLEFSDTDANMWYYPYLQRAYHAGIVHGMEDGSFGIGQKITRQDLSAMTYRAALGKGLSAEHGEQSYADWEQISEYARDAVSALQSLGILSGMEQNRFEPLQYATRAQAARIIYGILLALN